MKRITPNYVYAEMPCSVVAVGTAMGTADMGDVAGLFKEVMDGANGPKIHGDGYLSLDGLNGLIRAHLSVKKRENFKRGQRPALRDFAHSHLGQRAVICVFGHYLYFDGRDYYSFLWNGGDPVVAVWYLSEEG